MRTIYSDVLCIGAGLAGERVALAAAMEGFHTICLSVVPPRRSHSSAAQGGMQAALGNAVMGKGDSTDIHFADTKKRKANTGSSMPAPSAAPRNGVPVTRLTARDVPC